MRQFYTLLLATLCAFSSGCSGDSYQPGQDTCSQHSDCGDYEVCSASLTKGAANGGELSCRDVSSFSWEMRAHYSVLACEAEPDPCIGDHQTLYLEEGSTSWVEENGYFQPGSILRFIFLDYGGTSPVSDPEVAAEVFVTSSVLFETWKMSPSDFMEIGDGEGNTLSIELYPMDSL
jgi:hypothetical protein